MQQYYYYKKSLFSEDEEFPCHIDHIVKDTIGTVRPKLKLFENLQEADDSVYQLYQQLAAKAIEVLIIILVNSYDSFEV